MFEPEDVRITVYDPHEGRGMRVGLTYRGVQVEHLPSGTIARCHSCRSQHRNRAICFDMILAAITNPEFNR